jgi:hypothetical protein
VKIVQNIRIFGSLALCGLVAVAASIGDAVAQRHSAESDPPRIIFLHLRATNNGFELIDAKTVPGLLKVSRYDSNRDGLHFEVSSNSNQVLFQDVCPEPTVRRLEYEDPDHPGRIIEKQVTSISTEFTIRVPYFPEARTLRFYRPSSIALSVTPPDAKSKLVLQGEVTLPSSIQ